MSACEAVVIGGSAGALDVMIKTLGNLRRDLNFPLIVVLHRANTQDSALEEVLAAKSNPVVREIEDKEPLMKGVVYLVPADYHVLIEHNRVFSLDASEKVNYSRPSIDVTFESVAEVFGAGAVGILLSGGNNDGTSGLKRIHEVGGITCVQDPRTAQVAYMPEQALNALHIDRILKPEEMAEFINSL
jgi:two-component system chemotaxis response regulator CheB